MNRIHLVVLWHMHQPQYRDPETGRYVLPWTRLHALKDYYGMVETLREFPNFHATFNIVPALGAQLEEYASGKFNEPWFSLAFKNADELTREDKSEILSRAFQVNHEHLMSRWPRFVELHEWSRPAGGAQALVAFTARDWRDLQLLSQLAWMEESWLQKNELVSRLASRGKDYTENDKSALQEKQLELLRLILPAYRDAASRGQIEVSTTPFYHPILPLLCDSDVARVANPSTPLPRRAFRRPEDAREQLQLARQYHEKTFGVKPPGLWPSEGSVSDQTLSIAAEEGFQWFGTDEGVLGRTLNVGFFRDSGGIPANGDRLLRPWRIQLGDKSITGLFRDHHLSDLIGFVYSRMEAKAAATDLHSRLRLLGEKVSGNQPLTVCLFLDGENAWEYYPGNGREFLREFYRRIESDPDFRALRPARPSPQPGKFPPTPEFSPLPGSTPILTFGSVTARTSPPGSCCGTPARFTHVPSTRTRRGDRARRPKPHSSRRTTRSWRRRAVTGAGGSVPSTALQTTPNLMPSTASTSRKFISRLARSRPKNWPSPSSAARNTLFNLRQPAFCESRWTAVKAPTLNGSAPVCILPSAVAARCMAAFFTCMRCATALKRTVCVSASTISRRP